MYIARYIVSRSQTTIHMLVLALCIFATIVVLCIVAAAYTMLTALAGDVQLSCECACPAVETNFTCIVSGGLILSWKIIKVGGTMATDTETITSHSFNGHITTDLNKPIPVRQTKPVPFTNYYKTNVSTEQNSVTSVVTLNGRSDSENYRVECGVTTFVPCDILLAGKICSSRKLLHS